MALLCLPPQVKIGARFRESRKHFGLLVMNGVWEIVRIREGGSLATTYITLFSEGENLHMSLENLLREWEPVP